MTRIIIVDNSDTIIGHKERGTVTASDTYRVAALWITNARGDILLAQRKFTKKHDPGKWGPAVAGTVDEGETYDSNIVKEAEEEIGLLNITPDKGPKYYVTGEYNYFCQCYTLTIDTPADMLSIKEDEVEQIKWLTRDQLEKALANHPDEYLKGLSRLLEAFSPN